MALGKRTDMRHTSACVITSVPLGVLPLVVLPLIALHRQKKAKLS